MNDIANDRVGPMQNPPHLGELIRESMDDVGWNVTETAARLGCERGTLSRLLNGKAGVRRTWPWRWRISAGAPPSTGCGCRRAARMIGSRVRAAGGQSARTLAHRAKLDQNETDAESESKDGADG